MLLVALRGIKFCNTNATTLLASLINSYQLLGLLDHKNLVVSGHMPPFTKICKKHHAKHKTYRINKEHFCGLSKIHKSHESMYHTLRITLLFWLFYIDSFLLDLRRLNSCTSYRRFLEHAVTHPYHLINAYVYINS